MADDIDAALRSSWDAHRLPPADTALVPARNSLRITCGAPDPMATPEERAEVEASAARRERELQAEHDATRKPGEPRLRFRVSAQQYLSGEFGVSFWDEPG